MKCLCEHNFTVKQVKQEHFKYNFYVTFGF